MHAAISLAVSVAPSEAPILITGPSGAGKEKLAEIVQRSSRRKEGPSLKVNVGALPDDLLEAELFGAEAGAFTGAAKARTGRFEAASGGTLFLDEIGNLSPPGRLPPRALGGDRGGRADGRRVCLADRPVPLQQRRSVGAGDLAQLVEGERVGLLGTGAHVRSARATLNTTLPRLRPESR